MIEFLQELRGCTPATVEGHVAESEALFLESEGAILIGVFSTGAWKDELLDCSVCFVQGFAGHLPSDTKLLLTNIILKKSF